MKTNITAVLAYDNIMTGEELFVRFMMIVKTAVFIFAVTQIIKQIRS